MKKPKNMNEKEFLALLQKALAKATSDPRLASSIYDHVEKEVRLRNHVQSFEKFCEEGSVPDLEPATISEIQSQFATTFGENNVIVTPDEEGKALSVEIKLPEGSLTSQVKVALPSEEDEEVPQPFVPFPVAFPEDPELVWMLGRRENFPADEAARSLATIEEEFWATKSGQKLLREIGERSFAEFIAAVPASALAESHLKRHYKSPEPLKTLRLLSAAAKERNES